MRTVERLNRQAHACPEDAIAIGLKADVECRPDVIEEALEFWECLISGQALLRADSTAIGVEVMAKPLFYPRDWRHDLVGGGSHDSM